MQNLNKVDFIKTVNSLRLANKNSWYMWQGTVENKTVRLKGYKTWLQIFEVEGLRVPTVSDISVADFKKLLSDNV